MSRAANPTPPQSTRAEIWAREWGEVINKTDCGKMIGRHRATVHAHINNGDFKLAADGRIFTRSVAEWMDGKGVK